MKKNKEAAIGGSIILITLMLYGTTGIMLQYYVNSTLGDIYIFWGIFGAMLVSDKDLPRKVIFWIVFPIISWSYVCIGILLMFEYPKTWFKRLLVIYRRK